MLKLRDVLNKYAHGILFICLIGLILIPVIELDGSSNLFKTNTILLLIVLSGLSITYTEKRNVFRRLFGTVALVFSVLKLIMPSVEWIEYTTSIINVIFLFGLTIHMFRGVLLNKIVSLELILDAISVYLLIGVCFSIIFYSLHLVDASAFQLNNGDVDNMYNYIYFAFVTMTTLGYGDITPFSMEAKALSIVLAIFNIFYVGVIVATLVGKFLAEETNKK